MVMDGMRVDRWNLEDASRDDPFELIVVFL